jgi:hypothetical protein
VKGGYKKRKKQLSRFFSFLIVFVSFLYPGAQANASVVNPDINWEELQTWTYSYEYELYENSPMVEWLQYWLKVDPRDGIYGPITNREHRQKAMELNIFVQIHEYIVPDQNFGESVERWRSESISAIAKYGGPSTDISKFLRVMRCESGGDPAAFNASSGASGLMQHLSNYFPWRAKMAGYEGASPFDPIVNINVSAWLLYEHRAGGWQHWVCQ